MTGQIRWAKRARWVLSWSAYTDVIPATDTTPAVREPAVGARARVVDLDAPGALDGGVPATMGGQKPSLFEQTTPLRMAAGEVVELGIPNDDADAVGISGEAANAYWTSPAKIMSFTARGEMKATPFSSLFVQAEKPGQSEVTVEQRDGSQHRFLVLVSP